MSNPWPSKTSEKLNVYQDQVRLLTKLIKKGEGLHLEFKAKTTYPDKIVKEMIAFANAKGGTLLIGVNDDGVISGVKYPEEDSMLINKAIAKYCRPRIKSKFSYIRINEKKWVVAFEIRESNRKPVKFQESRKKLVTYVRHEDKSLQASREAEGILALKYGKEDVSFSYGDLENKILKVLDGQKQANFNELKNLTGIHEPILSYKLIRLAAANVIGWRPLDQSDIFISFQ